ncbi:MAG: hypothetical protein U0514_01215 [Candidatus Andersenbacteria bacterium]
MLGNAFESVVGSIYLDQGFEPARDFISRELLPELPTIIQQKLYLDSKSKLQEQAQDELHVTPVRPRCSSRAAPTTTSASTVGVYLGTNSPAQQRLLQASCAARRCHQRAQGARLGVAAHGAALGSRCSVKPSRSY